MRSRTAAMTTIVLLPLGACFAGPTTTDELSYSIDQPVTALVIGAQAATIVIAVGEGSVNVTEEVSYASGKPTTAHQVEGQTLRLTESGCPGDEDPRCGVRYTIRLPKATSADITAEAGAVKQVLDGSRAESRSTSLIKAPTAWAPCDLTLRSVLDSLRAASTPVAHRARRYLVDWSTW